MEFFSGESVKATLPFVDKYEGEFDLQTPLIVETLSKTPKGFLCVTSEYKAMLWIGSTAYDLVNSKFELLQQNSTLVSTAIYCRQSLSNPRNIEIALEENETNRALWKRVSDITFTASEILTKKKAKDRVAKFLKN